MFDVPSLTSSQRREQDEHAVFLIIPSLDNPEVATRVTNALRDAPGVHDVQLDLLEKLARIELFSAVSESDEVELADVVRRVENLIAYPVWQHRDRVVKLTIDGMRCMTNCGTQVIRALERVPGVLHIHVDSKSKTAEVTLGKGCTATEVDLIKCIRAANPRFDAFIAKDTGAARTHSNSIPGAVLLTIDAKSYDISSIRKIEAALRDTDGVIEATVEVASRLVIYCGRRFHIDAWKGLKNHVLGMSFLVSMGTNASYFYGIFTLIRSIALNDSSVSNPDMFMTAAMLVTFVVIGKYLEAVAKGKTSEALGKLLELQAKSANLLIFDRSGTKVVEEKVVAIELVQRGDILKVVRGSSIPADGIVVYGEGRVDESMLTGESKTIKKNVGDKDITSKELIHLAGSAELGSEHPLGKAIIDYAKFISISLEQPTNFKGVSGRGISCEVDGKKIVIGNREWMVDNGLQRLDSITLQQATVTFQNAGKTPVYMGVGVRICAVFGVADAPRPESVRTIAKLQQMGLDVWMVTGDNRRTAISIADQLGISRRNVMAEVIPSDKASKVKQLQSSGRRVAMVGDGINDSPALAQADLGIAIGAGTEIAVETAGMVLMKSNLWDVISALDLSRTIFNRIRINYGWAMGYNCLLIPLAAGALYPFGFSIPPMFAGGAMALSSVSVVTSSLLLRYYSPPEMPDVYSANENKSVLFRKPSEATPLLASSSMD
ncbi:hypothetical protein ATCC90586_002107 [Pythium insidiosum]|nr:hypothetical protein ATCC90586_002107 [Pythium insidiosum]